MAGLTLQWTYSPSNQLTMSDPPLEEAISLVDWIKQDNLTLPLTWVTPLLASLQEYVRNAVDFELHSLTHF